MIQTHDKKSTDSNPDPTSQKDQKMLGLITGHGFEKALQIKKSYPSRKIIALMHRFSYFYHMFSVCAS
jgi:hypothetical protein